MPRGPRRGNASIGQAPTDERTQRRHERKLEKVLANSHGGFAGKSIIELLEDELTSACVEYLAAKRKFADMGLSGALGDDQSRIDTARGKIRGLAVSVAMMRHPLRRHEQHWWGYVKRLEKRHILLAKELDLRSE